MKQSSTRENTTHTRRILLGAAAFIASLLVLITTQFVAQLAWHNPTYDTTFNNISDLGNVKCQHWSDDQRFVCSPRHEVTNIGFLAGGVIFLIGMVLTRGLWKPTRRGTIAHLIVASAGVLWLTVGIWPADINEGIHLTAWLWLCLGLSGLIISYSSLQPTVPRWLRFLALVIGIVGLTIAFAFVGQQYFGMGRGIAERLAVYSLSVWSTVLGLWIVKRRAS